VTVARLQADLDAAIARGVPASIIASLRQRLAAAQAADAGATPAIRGWIGQTASTFGPFAATAPPRRTVPLGRRGQPASSSGPQTSQQLLLQARDQASRGAPAAIVRELYRKFLAQWARENPDAVANVCLSTVLKSET
jgi:hypothetical protein